LENSYSGPDKEQTQKQQREQQRESSIHQREGPGPALAQGLQLIQAGAKLQDLSPQQAREVAAVLGNQNVLQLLRGGSPVKLAPAPPGGRTEEALPVTEVDIRWPAVTVPPKMIRDGPIPPSIFPADHFRPMGVYGSKGVPPDG